MVMVMDGDVNGVTVMVIAIESVMVIVMILFGCLFNLVDFNLTTTNLIIQLIDPAHILFLYIDYLLSYQDTYQHLLVMGSFVSDFVINKSALYDYN